MRLVFSGADPVKGVYDTRHVLTDGWPTVKLTMDAVPTDDQEITCIVCMEPKCTHEVKAWAPIKGTRVWFGIHKRCADASEFCKETVEDHDGIKTTDVAALPGPERGSDQSNP